MKSIVLIDHNMVSGDTLFNTLRIKLQRHRDNMKTLHYKLSPVYYYNLLFFKEGEVGL